MKDLVKWILLVSCITFLMGGCGGKQVPPDDGVIKIGLLIDTIVVERWQRDRDIFSAKAKELGAEVIVQKCNEDNATQELQVKTLVNDGIDVLVVIPYDKDGLTDSIKAARKRGIPVISYDRLIQNADVSLYISFDNEMVGELMGSELVKKVPNGKYVIVNGSPLDNNSSLFNKGYKNTLTSAIQKGDIQIISETWAEAWRPEDAYKVLSSLLQDSKKFDAVIAANDGLAGGVIKALSEHRLAGVVQVVGHDADLSACQRIAEIGRAHV